MYSFMKKSKQFFLAPMIIWVAEPPIWTAKISIVCSICQFLSGDVPSNLQFKKLVSL